MSVEPVAVENIYAKRRRTPEVLETFWMDDIKIKEVTGPQWQRKARDLAQWKTLGEIFVQESAEKGWEKEEYKEPNIGEILR